jgi:uncharacterized membrane protein YccC
VAEVVGAFARQHGGEEAADRLPERVLGTRRGLAEQRLERGSRAIARFSELLPELARAERDVAEGQARIARQAQLVRELDADGHDTTFSAKRLLVMMANLNQMETGASRSSGSCRSLKESLRPDSPWRRRGSKPRPNSLPATPGFSDVNRAERLMLARTQLKKLEAKPPAG